MRFASFVGAAAAGATLLGLFTMTPAPALAQHPAREAAAGKRPTAVSAQRSVGSATRAGSWLVDRDGRVIISHGLNLIWKTAPYYPTAFSAADARFLASQGFSGARIGFLWAGVEPRPGHYDEHYILRIAHIDSILGRYGIRTLVDFHQDSYSAKYGGDGAPAWASLDGGCGPLVPCTLLSSLQAFQHLWDNTRVDGVGLTRQFTRAWERGAKALRGEHNLLGYDLFNEPYAGSKSLCVPFLPCHSFETTTLPTFYRTVLAGVRREDPKTVVFYEPIPQLLGGATALPAPLSKDRELGFTYHYYARDCGALPQPTSATVASLQDARCTPEESKALNAGISYARKANVAVDLGEFGDSSNDTDVANMVDLAGARSLNWTYWAYYSTGASLAPGLLRNDRVPGSVSNARTDLLNDLVVPYPQAVAGTPGAYSYGRSSRIMTFRYQTQRVRSQYCSAAPTSIFIPERDYPHGYRVKVTGARVVSRPTAAWVDLVARPDARRVTVTVRPRRGSHTQVPTTAVDTSRLANPTCRQSTKSAMSTR